MNKFLSFFFISLSCFLRASSQDIAYRDSIIEYQRNYIDTHEVVPKMDRKYIHFFNINKSYRISASFKKINDNVGFDMLTSAGKKSKYYKYGSITFKLRDSLVQLYVYQSEDLMKQPAFKDYLFVPFRDATSGLESYGGGRYLEFYIKDIKDKRVTIDFNKAYNPYCAYTSGYNCPLPPVENTLSVLIKAGERNYGKSLH